MRINRFNYYIFLTILILFVFFLINTHGINMTCNKCYNEGRHIHLSHFPEGHINHGPKIRDKFKYDICNICKNNEGGYHYHLG